MEKAKGEGSRLLFASTSEVYGDPQVHPQVEEYWGNVNPIGPRSIYDEAKRYGEALCMAFSRQGTDVRIIRIFNTYGPMMRHDDGRVIPNFIKQALQRKPLTIYGDGSQTRSFCFVDDLTAGMNALMESSLMTPCNIGNPIEMTMLHLFDIWLVISTNLQKIQVASYTNLFPQMIQREGNPISLWQRNISTGNQM